MALRIETPSPRYGQMPFDSYPSSAASPQFADPWTAPGYAHHGMNSGLSLDIPKHHHGGRGSISSSSSISSYGSMPPTTASTSGSQMGGVFAQQEMLGMGDLLNMNRLPNVSAASYPESTYSSSTSPVHGGYATTAAPYDALAYAAPPMRSTYPVESEPAHSRRYSPMSVPSSISSDPSTMRNHVPYENRMATANHRGLHDEERRGFASALDSSRGLLPASEETPRNIYGSRSDRSSTDSYGFPSTHSTSSSISSNGNFSNYYGGDSVSDYSTAGSDIESVTSRTLPRPQGLMTTQPPPAPQSMMSQFSSKVSSSTQKKHKCKVCDKRFMRPSSLQTHMYSHTGEKPFACEVEGCGRHFSVVSNLRRHRKVHKSDARSEACSEEHLSD